MLSRSAKPGASPRRGHAAGECRHPVGVEGIQSTASVASLRGLACMPGAMSRERGLFWQKWGTRERGWLSKPSPLSPMALTAWPAVTSRIAGACWMACSMTSVRPSSANMPATRPRGSKTCGGTVGASVGYQGETMVASSPPLPRRGYRYPKITQLYVSGAECRFKSLERGELAVPAVFQGANRVELYGEAGAIIGEGLSRGPARRAHHAQWPAGGIRSTGRWRILSRPSSSTARLVPRWRTGSAM